jgi:hypothetical protein
MKEKRKNGDNHDIFGKRFNIKEVRAAQAIAGTE